MSGDLVAAFATVVTAVVVVLGGIYALFRFVFLAPLRISIDRLADRVDTVTELLGQHRHSETGTVVAPIRGGDNGEDG